MSITRYAELMQLARDRLPAHHIKRALSLAVGIVLSRKIPLPASEVDSLTDYYITSVANNIASMACGFNEKIVIDLDLACETARQFWMIRYHHAFPPAQIPFLSDDTGHFMGRIAGCGHMIPSPEFNFCQENANAMIQLVNRLQEIVDGPGIVECGNFYQDALVV